MMGVVLSLQLILAFHTMDIPSSQSIITVDYDVSNFRVGYPGPFINGHIHLFYRRYDNAI